MAHEILEFVYLLLFGWFSDDKLNGFDFSLGLVDMGSLEEIYSGE